jgi:hypothetical protein
VPQRHRLRDPGSGRKTPTRISGIRPSPRPWASAGW